jgi:hypothetical protein
MDIYQGKMTTISPAIGPYDINVYINIDKVLPTEATGGITGMGTLEPIKWDMGVTGIDGANFTNLGHGF